MVHEEDNTKQATIRQRKLATKRSRQGLIRYARDVTSQNGEDGIIHRIFELLPKSTKRFCVDIGAWDGKHLSNTYSLLHDSTAEWGGLLVEANAQRCQELRKLYSEKQLVRCLNLSVSCSSTSKAGLVRILDEYGTSIELPEDFDFLSIDIDGADYWLLHSLLNMGRYQPKVICVEFNPTMPDDLIYIPPRNDIIRHGCSLAALVELAEQHGYRLVETTLFNAFFVPNLLYTAFLREEVPDTTIETLHEITMGTSLYQLYDGTLKLSGCKKMLWHRVPLEEEKLQMLTKQQREFPFAPPDDTFDMSAVVDMSAYQRDSSEEQRKCKMKLLQVLEKDGFCLIHKTPVTSSLCQEALSMTAAFLQTADESVRRSCLAPDRARRGYSPMNTENFGSLLGNSIDPNDLVRKFRVGPYASKANSALLQPNVWPDEWDMGSDFREIIQSFYQEICQTADIVVQAICEGLITKNPELQASLEPLLQRDGKTTTSILTLLGYRVGSRHRGKNKGPLVAAHTDVGVVTVLVFDGGDCATLQRKDGDGWADVTLPPLGSDPVLVVNIADCLSDLSGLPSTVHRVVAGRIGTQPRNCLALFVGLNPDTALRIHGRDMSYEEWRQERILRASRALKK